MSDKELGPWIGVDLDATLSFYKGWVGGAIGAPIPAMVDRVKAWLAEGKDVRIVTARVAEVGRIGGEEVEEQYALIRAWCRQHLGREIPIQCHKDYGMVALWDDRAVRVVANTGEACCGTDDIVLPRALVLRVINRMRGLASEMSSPRFTDRHADGPNLRAYAEELTMHMEKVRE